VERVLVVEEKRPFLEPQVGVGTLAPPPRARHAARAGRDGTGR